LQSEEEESLPQPVFKKRLTEKIGASQTNGFEMNTNVNPGGSYDSFSERLVESINMVRELLKGNKELREQL
jgi:hypothetical protein